MNLLDFGIKSLLDEANAIDDAIAHVREAYDRQKTAAPVKPQG